MDAAGSIFDRIDFDTFGRSVKGDPRYDAGARRSVEREEAFADEINGKRSDKKSTDAAQMKRPTPSARSEPAAQGAPTPSTQGSVPTHVSCVSSNPLFGLLLVHRSSASAYPLESTLPTDRVVSYLRFQDSLAEATRRSA